MFKRPGPWFMVGAAVFLSSLLFTPAGATIFLPGDVTVYLLNASRMLQGQTIYKDFFQFTPPGTESVYFVLFRLFSPRAWLPNVTLLILALSLVWLSITISGKLMQGRAVFLPGLLMLAISFYHGLDPSHQWFSVLAVLLATVLIIERRTPWRVAVVGMLCGLASFFTQARGLLAVLGFAVFLLWEHRRKLHGRPGLFKKQALLAASFLSTLVATNVYFAWKAGLRPFLDSTVIFGVRYYPADSLSNTLRTYMVNLPSLRPWYGLHWVVAYLGVHFLVPGAYLLFAVRYWKKARHQPQHPWDRLMLINIAGVFLFASVAPAPSYFRLCVVSLPALILFVWLLTLPGRLERVLIRLVWTFALLMAVVDTQQVQRHASDYIDLPSGRTAFLQPIYYERFKWLSQQTRPTDFFFEASWADSYVALGLRNPAPVPFVTNSDYTRPEQVRAVVGALEARRVRFVLWLLDLDIPQNDSGVGDHLGPLRADLHAHYHAIKGFADGEQVWERKE